jgi:hypothetical protein
LFRTRRILSAAAAAPAAAGYARDKAGAESLMVESWVNQTVPRLNERELVSHGEQGYLPFRTRDSSGKRSTCL